LGISRAEFGYYNIEFMAQITSVTSERNIRLLRRALVLTTIFLFIELAAGFVTNSLALLSDVGHMLSDVVTLLISLYAAHLSRKAPTATKSYGYYRTEVLAALFNGLGLWLIIGIIYYEAFHRLQTPDPVNGVGVIVIGFLGLLVNLAAAWMLHGHQDLNIRGAYYHVITDALGSLGAFVSGVLIFLTGWYIFDPLLSLLIGGLVLYSSWSLIRDSINILMESVPKHLDPMLIRKQLLVCDGVANIHDLHIWSIGSQSHALSAHIVVSQHKDPSLVRSRVEEVLKKQFDLDHTTLQIEIQEACIEAIHE
jgi:cobalt-zinc-cadmium efflux system protein